MKCGVCGKKLSVRDKFCTGCGTKIEKRDVIAEMEGHVLVATVNVPKLNAINRNAVHKELKRHIMEGNPAVVLNLNCVEVMDTMALGMIAELSNYLKKNYEGKIVTCCQGEYVKKIFEVSGYSRIIENYESTAEAISSLEDLVKALEAKKRTDFDFDKMMKEEPKAN